MAVIRTGAEEFLRLGKKYASCRMGLVTNNAATTFEGYPVRKMLLQHGFDIKCLFSPEHGLSVTGTDGAAQPDSTDPMTGLPVHSLYGPRQQPDARHLASVDILLFDLPDVGCRFYTYLWTMTAIMETCALAGKPLVVLDRPNPLGALPQYTEGPMLDETTCSSFVGRYSIPLRHGATIGELAGYFAHTYFPRLQLEVVKMKGYQRHFMAGRDFAFTPTSPAMLSAHAAILYPGTGLFEGVNVHEGRGTPFPFAQLGAPWIEVEFAHELSLKVPAGIRADVVSYVCQTQPYPNQNCSGWRCTVTDATAFSPVAFALELLQALATKYPNKLSPRAYPTHANPSGERHLDKLLGINNCWGKIVSLQAIDTEVPQKWFDDMLPFRLYA